MGLLAPRSAVLGDLWVMLRHVGGKMATKSAKMSQHRRQEANPRGFEGSAGARDGRHHLELGFCSAGREAPPGVGILRRSWPRGVARTGFFILLLEA